MLSEWSETCVKRLNFLTLDPFCGRASCTGVVRSLLKFASTRLCIWVRLPFRKDVGVILAKIVGMLHSGEWYSNIQPHLQLFWRVQLWPIQPFKVPFMLWHQPQVDPNHIDVHFWIELPYVYTIKSFGRLKSVATIIQKRWFRKVFSRTLSMMRATYATL